MNNPELWGFSTVPLTFPFWGWEDSSDLKRRFERAPGLVHLAQAPGVASVLARERTVAAVVSPPKFACASYSGVTAAGFVQVPSCSIVKTTRHLSTKGFTPKAQNHAFVEKVVKGQARTPLTEAASPVCVRADEKRGVPNIST